MQVDNECCYPGHQALTAFSFRVHTHHLGREVAMTRELWNHSGVYISIVNVQLCTEEHVL